MKEIILDRLIIKPDNMTGIITYFIKDNNKTDKTLRSLKIDNMQFPKIHLRSIIEVILNTVKREEGL